ncbi:hypothetical protein F7758_08540 [Salmonella enterica subsp. enterica]|nr:hypothetical protein [Salmonella enterica subsp. enterica serovar Potsdam]ECY4822350.1 hypothetical protein [Salmonella enterica subsp. enterica serovar Lindern]ECZ0087125.1 hypothetical protein [Salmonella enterica subsp. enterica serovar Miami]EDD8586511.1 hypothetical protein [Salmonella enterica subsp. enterica serovar Abony]EEC5248741.1 hypothetical protein [Salmonella enterica subsp. enterica]
MAEHIDKAKIYQFSMGYAFKSQHEWRDLKERCFFGIVVGQVLLHPEKIDELAEEFCTETSHERTLFDQLMSEMYCEWNKLV